MATADLYTLKQLRKAVERAVKANTLLGVISVLEEYVRQLKAFAVQQQPKQSEFSEVSRVASNTKDVKHDEPHQVSEEA